MLFMAGINYKDNCISKREEIYFDPEKTADICRNIYKLKDIDGIVILSTCNRTEIYLSAKVRPEEDADKILLKYSGIKNFDGIFEKREGEDAVHHIIELACGIKSQIIGESQIAGQINRAVKISRENGCSDPTLNTLFRIAVSAGKYVLANAVVSNVPISSASAAVEFLKNKYKNIENKKCVVIGNGKMGKIVQSLLIKNGCRVFVTLRNYKHGGNKIIKGCKAIEYKERYVYADGADFIISATKGPHYTITYDEFKNIRRKPEIILDIAVPRDVEPAVSKEWNCIDIDGLGLKPEISAEKLNLIYDIAEKFAEDFFNWENYRLSLPDIEIIKRIVSERIIIGNAKDGYEGDIDEIIRRTAEKTADIILGGIKEYITPEIIKLCRNKIRERARL